MRSPVAEEVAVSVIVLPRGLQAAEVVTHEVFQRDRDLRIVELGVGEVGEEAEHGPIRNECLVVDADAGAVAGLDRSPVASLSGDEARVSWLADAVEGCEDPLISGHRGELVAAAWSVEGAGAEAAARDAPHGRPTAVAKL